MEGRGAEMTGLLQDLKYGIRMLAKNPGFTLVALLTLAVGIGANTVMFSFVNAWVIHPLPYAHPDRLVAVLTKNTKTGNTILSEDVGDFYDFQSGSRSFEQLSVWSPASFNLTGDGEPERVQGARVTWNFFETLGVQPALGRAFLPREDQAGAGHVAILSRGLWQARYASDPQIIGRNIQVGGETYTVVGVMPAKFQLPLLGEANFWTPLALTDAEKADRANNWIFVLGRLKKDATVAGAQAELSGIAARLEKQYPKTNTNAGVAVHTLEYEIGREQGNQEVIILFGTVWLVLLIACANIANLTLTRATARTRELAVRAAMGAGRGRLIRQLVTETVLVFLAGSLASLAVAHFGLVWLESIIPARIRGFLVNYGEVDLDVATLLYTFGVALAAGIVFGILPAISATKLDVNQRLKESSGRTTGHRQGSRLRGALVVGEIALAIVTAICCVLLVRACLGLTKVNPGFRPENVIVVRLDLPATKYKDPSEIRNFYDQVMGRLRGLPQVDAVGAGSDVPFTDYHSTATVFDANKPEPDPGETPWADSLAVTPGYFVTLGIKLMKGRLIESSDGVDAPPVAVVNPSLAERFWPGQDPIGQKLHIKTDAEENTIVTVVGVVNDIKLYNSPKTWHDREIYVPFAQFPSRGVGIVARSSSAPDSLASAIRSAVWSVDDEQPLSQVRPLEALMEEQYTGFNITAELMGFFVVLAIFLGAIGIYAVMASNVAARTHEIGIRLALGAQRGSILRLILGSGAWLAALGIAIGLLVALGASQLLAGILNGLSPRDAATYAECAVFLAGVALAACYIPARRAMRVDPMVALRYE
jgi:putative ABC transport system permease protein